MEDTPVEGQEPAESREEEEDEGTNSQGDEEEEVMGLFLLLPDS